LVDDRQCRIETHFLEANGHLSRARLDVERLSHAVKALGGDVQRVRSRLDVLRGDWRVADELTIEEDLRIRNVSVDTQRSEFRSRRNRCGRLSGSRRLSRCAR